jgi:hypothetical protein
MYNLSNDEERISYKYHNLSIIIKFSVFQYLRNKIWPYG